MQHILFLSNLPCYWFKSLWIPALMQVMPKKTRMPSTSSPKALKGGDNVLPQISPVSATFPHVIWFSIFSNISDVQGGPLPQHFIKKLIYNGLVFIELNLESHIKAS